jgi:DNA-binding CsgD family transcriptional regulator
MPDSDEQPLLEPLTDRESDVLRLMTAGRTTTQIAAELFVTVATVRWYAKQIYAKLGVHSRTQAVLRAVELGMFEGTPIPSIHPEPASPPHNLPVYGTRFIGREKELQDLIDLLQDPQVRLVTIAGPGGIGKTRLGVEAARAQLGQFLDGIFLVPLAALNSVTEIVPAIARQIHLALKSDAEPEEQLRSHLRTKRMLLLLDSFEDVLDGAELVARLLAAASGLKILATSQRSLNLQLEWVRYLDGMQLPSSESDEDFKTYGAVRLFLDRVRQANGDFSPDEHRACVIEICQLVQGVPLAIELAAAWLKTLSCNDVVAEIRRSLDFLATDQPDVDPGHHSMRAVFDHAWRLLTEEERQVLMRLSVFPGGFSRTAAEQVAGASLQTLSGLIEKSFLTQSPSGRYEIHGLLRRYSAQELEAQATTAPNPRSKMLLVWSSLVEGDLEKARELARSLSDKRKAGMEPPEQACGLALMGVLAGMAEDYDHCLQLCAASLALGKRRADPQDPITPLLAHLGLAVGSAGRGDLYSARHSLRLALGQAVTLRSPAFITLCLPVAAIILAHQGERARAVELLGLAFSHHAGAPSWMREWRPVADVQADLGSELGADAYGAAWASGAGRDPEGIAQDLLRDFRTANGPVPPTGT